LHLEFPIALAQHRLDLLQLLDGLRAAQKFAFEQMDPAQAQAADAQQHNHGDLEDDPDRTVRPGRVAEQGRCEMDDQPAQDQRKDRPCGDPGDRAMPTTPFDAGVERAIVLRRGTRQAGNVPMDFQHDIHDSSEKRIQ